MPTPDPRKPGDASPVPDDDDHGGKLAKLFRDLETNEIGEAPAPAPMPMPMPGPEPE
jgi:hypothetical protein